MFRPGKSARVFATQPGVDLPRALIHGLTERLNDQPPESWARVEIFVTTRRMQRRIMDLFGAGPARLLPRIRTISDLGQDDTIALIPAPISALRRRLELIQLVGALLEREPDLAPRTSLFDLADSLAALMDEMQGEGVTPADLHALDVDDLSGHWQRSLKFLKIVEQFFGPDTKDAPDAEARQRLVIEAVITRWQDAPPKHPIIVAGSTGSRGATAMFMHAVARLPQGALILPGFDTDLPGAVWERLNDNQSGEDHPQFRFARLLSQLSLDPTHIQLWDSTLSPASAARGRLTSLALRPAPVTDQWLSEGQDISRHEIEDATNGLTLIEAPSPRAEAVAIALRLRKAVEEGQEAALITPDRNLTRQVTAALARWDIEPDDSAGRPLALSAPGRFLRHICELFGQKLTAAALLTLLKHPLCATGGARGDHLRWTRDLELELLRKGLPFPTGPDLTNWAKDKHKGDAPRMVWAVWLAQLLAGLEQDQTLSLPLHVKRHIALAESFANGPNLDKPHSELWEKAAGRAARTAIDELINVAPAGGHLNQPDYRDLLRAVLNRGEVHDPDAPHPGVMIWGTMEARVQGPDLVILGGLNDGTWPEAPTPDPWLNRKMRAEAGLLLPERRIGLSAHDFQQAFAAREVVISRAVRDAESETIASRWLMRLTNLLTGLPSGGPDIIETMRRRGRVYLDLAARLDALPKGALPPAARPSPRPPIDARPKRLSVTRISKLVRDPYSIYAQSVLALRPLEPLQQTPDAPLRGNILHRIVERFIELGAPPDHPDARAHFMQIANDVLEDEVPWPAARILWHAKLERVVDHFLTDETMRQHDGNNLANEVKGCTILTELDFTLSGTADRIDALTAGCLVIYDYKSGTLPTKIAQTLYDKQLKLEAVIAREGGFKNVPQGSVSRIAYIGLGKIETFKFDEISDEEVAEVRAELQVLIGKYQSRDQGYSALRFAPDKRFSGDYEHLARFGEWDISQMPEPEDVG